jgi:hypothetical protein
MTHRYKMSLLDNGLDFVATGIDVFFPDDRPDGHAHKYALLHISAGLLLLLKERLRREHEGRTTRTLAHALGRSQRTTHHAKPWRPEPALGISRELAGARRKGRSSFRRASGRAHMRPSAHSIWRRAARPLLLLRKNLLP